MASDPLGYAAANEETAHLPTPVAVVGTLAEFRREPVPYDPGELVRFVAAIDPDLLCLDMTPDEWRRRDFGGLPVEYRDALLPLASQTDIVVVPIGDDRTPARGDVPAPTGLRGWLRRRLRSTLARLARGTDSPVSVGEGVRHLLVEHLLHLLDAVERGRSAQRTTAAHRHALVDRILELAHRDPAARILVVVNARHCHQLRRTLREHQEVALIHHSNLSSARVE